VTRTVDRVGRAFVLLLALGVIGAPRRVAAQAGEAGPAELWQSALPDVGAWLEEPGRAAWSPMRALGLGVPLVHAGLVRGAWSFDDPGQPPEGRPFPGLLAALPPLVGDDSLTAEPGRALDPGGPERALGVVRSMTAHDPAGRPRAMFSYVNGDFGLSEAGLVAERGGEAGHVRVETFSSKRDSTGPYGSEGRHRWSFVLGRTFRFGELSGSYRQAAVAAGLQSGEQETARGGSGRLDWRSTYGSWRTALGAARQWDSHESFGVTLDPSSRRDAQELNVEGSAVRAIGVRELGFRADWNHGRVARVDTLATGTNHDDEWGTVWLTTIAPTSRWSAEVAGGRVGATGNPEVAPALRYERTFPAGRLESWAGRLLEPIWSDVADHGPGFLQSTWTAGAGWLSRTPTTLLHLRAIGGRTRDRAVVARLPLEEQWLRAGIVRDPNPWQFLELWGEARWSHRAWIVGAEGCGLVKKFDPLQTRVDPDWTARGYAEWGFHAFQGDLGVRLRAGLDGIGARNTDEPNSRELPGYVTSSAGATFTIGDAHVTIHARNLENRRRDEVWIDSRTGLPAQGMPREVRVALTWRLNN